MIYHLSTLLGVGVVLRLVLIAYGEWHDTHMDLKYTDIDYSIFSDAAIHVSKVAIYIVLYLDG